MFVYIYTDVYYYICCACNIVWSVTARSGSGGDGVTMHNARHRPSHICFVYNFTHLGDSIVPLHQSCVYCFLFYIHLLRRRRSLRDAMAWMRLIQLKLIAATGQSMRSNGIDVYVTETFRWTAQIYCIYQYVRLEDSRICRLTKYKVISILQIWFLTLVRLARAPPHTHTPSCVNFV